MLPYESSALKCAIIGVNKIKNITSAKLVDKLKDIVHKFEPGLKMGHGGTLDETATGVLVVGCGNGCKILSEFLHGTKQYVVVGKLGIETDTLNETGKVVKVTDYSHVTQEGLVSCTKRFLGNTLQIPPIYSALKLHGQRYSDLALDGKEVFLKPRPVQCHFIQLLDFNPPLFELRVSCGRGFYIRSLVRDIGNAVGSCAHVTSLHRCKHGFITEDNTVSYPFTYDKLLENALRIQQMRQFRQMQRQLDSLQTKTKRNKLWIDPT